MKQLLLSLIFILSTFLTNAQIGIGTTSPDPSSILEVQSTTKGFLAPRINLSSVTNSSIDGANTNAAGLLIYNTNASVTGGNGAGYYYWDGSIWVSMNATPSDQEWKLDGNSVAATAFLGTTNAQNLRIRTNNTERFNFSTDGQLLYTNGGIEVGSASTGTTTAIAIGQGAEGAATNSSAVGPAALASQNSGSSFGYNARATNTEATAIGSNTRAEGLESVTVGNESLTNASKAVAVGAFAQGLAENTIAIGNEPYVNAAEGIGVGTKARATGTNAVAIGSAAEGAKTNANAFGYNAKATEINTTAIGANTRATADNALSLGYHADATANNTIAIGNAAAAVNDNAVAIGLNAKPTANNSIGIGNGVTSVGNQSLVIGYSANAGGQSSIAIGDDATVNGDAATGNSSIAIGRQAQVNAANAVALGAEAIASTANTIILGKHDNASLNVGIGTNTPSAKLQVNGSFRFVDATPGDDANKVLTSDANGNASWQTPSSGGGASGWALTGNSIASGNFLGTTNDQPLRIRTNNTERFSFTTAGQMVFNAGIELGLSSNSNSNDAIAIGRSSNAYAANAIAIGNAANATEDAISLGNAGATAQGAIRLGNGGNANGTNSVSLGTNSNSYGSNSIAIGNNSGAANNAVALGNGVNAYAANTMILGNNLNVGIGTNNPQAKLHLTTSFRYADGTQGAGKVLTSDGAGDATWQEPANTSLEAYGEMYDSNGGGQSTNSGGTSSYTRSLGAASVLKNVIHSNSAYYLEVQVSGIYEVTYNATVLGDDGSRVIEFYIEAAPGNNSFVKIDRSSSYVTHLVTGDRQNTKRSILVSLDANDRIRLRYATGAGDTSFPANTCSLSLKRIGAN